MEALVPVTSSQVKAIGYDQATKTLAIKFNSGGVYHYDNVEPEKHTAFMAAESKGKFFGKEIRGKHEHRKVAEPEKAEEKA